MSHSAKLPMFILTTLYETEPSSRWFTDEETVVLELRPLAFLEEHRVIELNESGAVWEGTALEWSERRMRRLAADKLQAAAESLLLVIHQYDSAPAGTAFEMMWEQTLSDMIGLTARVIGRTDSEVTRAAWDLYRARQQAGLPLVEGGPVPEPARDRGLMEGNPDFALIEVRPNGDRIYAPKSEIFPQE
jgi:hypothetical protein